MDSYHKKNISTKKRKNMFAPRFPCRKNGCKFNTTPKKMHLKKQQKGKRTKPQKIGSVSLKSLDFNAPEKTTKEKKEKQKNGSVSLKSRIAMNPKKQQKGKRRKTKTMDLQKNKKEKQEKQTKLANMFH